MMDTLSLIISVAAIIIAALAAGFTLWQARSSAQQVVEARRANRLIEEDLRRALERPEQERLAPGPQPTTGTGLQDDWIQRDR
jgi:uncharacterized protein (DUF1778 family)